MRRAARAALPCVAALALAACSSPASTATPGAPATTPSAAAPLQTPVPPSPPASALIPVAGRPPVTGRPWYLVIGDSVSFGYSVDPARYGTNSSWALQMEPMLAAAGRPWQLYDTACPSETTSTYTGRCPLRRFVPALADESQHDLALAAVAAHRADLRLIVVELGANDLLHAGTLDAAAVIPRLSGALTRIVTELQRTAPGVPVILCNYYDPLENLLPATVAPLDQVNTAVAALAARLHVGLADIHAAINTAPPPDPGLGRYVDVAHTDIHPTVLGHTRIAEAVLRTVLSLGGT